LVAAGDICSAGALDDHRAYVRALDRLSDDRRDKDRTIKGLNFFKRSEQALLRALQAPQFNIRRMRRAALIVFAPKFEPGCGACPGGASASIRHLRMIPTYL
jgi:hypothetical protein